MMLYRQKYCTGIKRPKQQPNYNSAIVAVGNTMMTPPPLVCIRFANNEYGYYVIAKLCNTFRYFQQQQRRKWFNLCNIHKRVFDYLFNINEKGDDFIPSFELIKSVYATAAFLGANTAVKNYVQYIMPLRLRTCQYFNEYYKNMILDNHISRSVVAAATTSRSRSYFGLVLLNDIYMQYRHKKVFIPESEIFLGNPRHEGGFRNGQPSFDLRHHFYRNNQHRLVWNVIFDILTVLGGKVAMCGGFALSSITRFKYPKNHINNVNLYILTHEIEFVMNGIEMILLHHGSTGIRDVKITPATITYYCSFGGGHNNTVVPFQLMRKPYQNLSCVLHSFDIPACQIGVVYEDAMLKWFCTKTAICCVNSGIICVEPLLFRGGNDNDNNGRAYQMRLFKYFFKGFDIWAPLLSSDKN